MGRDTQEGSPIVARLLGAGDPAPDFNLPAAPGRNVGLADFAGKKLVLFFYPKDDTAVCTREAADFSDMQSRFSRQGVSILGVSRDPVEKHRKFIAKHGLKTKLASDEDGAMCEAYGVWGEKTLYGRKYMGIIRTTFLIGEDGLIREVWRNVRVPGHAEAVLAAAKG